MRSSRRIDEVDCDMHGVHTSVANRTGLLTPGGGTYAVGWIRRPSYYIYDDVYVCPSTW